MISNSNGASMCVYGTAGGVQAEIHRESENSTLAMMTATTAVSEGDR